MEEKVKVLCVGGAGRFAGMVVPELARRGAHVRAMVRDEAASRIAKANGAAETVFADLRQPDTLVKAATGMDGVFHIGPVFAVDEARMGLNMIDAARLVGVRKFVYSSVIQPTNTDLENHASKIPVENALFASGMAYTILHPANLFQNFGSAWKGIVATGIYAEPNPVDRRLARVDYRDVAEVAAIALTDDRLAYGTFELCSQGMLTRQEIGAMAARALGRPVEVREIGFGEWARTVRLPYDERAKAILAKIHGHIAAHGMSGNSLALHAVLGRPPRSMQQFIGELATMVPAQRSAARAPG
jgi:uncharacterized protein YbjT (DUF2867 family)